LLERQAQKNIFAPLVHAGIIPRNPQPLTQHPMTFQLEEQLKCYRPHDLTDLSAATLMDRVDTKYILPLDCLPEILNALAADFTAQVIDGSRVFSYENTYFDTPSQYCYLMHHNGLVSRYKVRHRRYLATQTSFIEIKKKNNQFRTIKQRIQIQPDNVDWQEVGAFVNEHTQGCFSELEPFQSINYQRITLANEAVGERLTLDMNLSFQNLDTEKLVALPNLFIAELKQARINLSSPFFAVMRNIGYRPLGFSKYSIACCITSEGEIKKNNFKPVLLHLEKLARRSPNMEMLDVQRV